MNPKAIVEGLLFLSGEEGIDESNIIHVLDCKSSEVEKIMNEIENDLRDESRGLMLVKLANRYKLSTKPDHFTYYQKLIDNPINFNFSNATLEVLAIIAYNEPITRAEIEDIRGVNSDSIVKKLLARSLIREYGIKDSVGKPMQFVVTKEFMDYFNLKDLSELPDISKYNEEDENELDIFDTNFKGEDTNG